METILKIPLYIKVRSEETDRSKVTKVIQQVVIPEVVSHLVAFSSSHLSFNQQEIVTLKMALGDFDCKLLSDVDAMVRKD